MLQYWFSLKPKTNLNVVITSSGSVTAALNKQASFTAAITASGNVTANNIVKIYLAADILVTGNIGADIDERLVVIDTLSISDDVDTFNNERIGNTLLLTSYVGIQTELNIESDLSVSLTQNVTHTDVYNRSAANLGGHPHHEWDFSQSVSVKRVLAVKEASSVLELEQTLSEYRLAENTLIFEQLAEVYIYFIPCIASNELILTQEAISITELNLNSINTLVLIQEVDPDIIREYEVESNLFLHQYVFGVNLKTKRYTLLQAPFDLIQTSIVLPNPLWDDSENLVSNMILKKSMNNVTYTYVKSNKNRLLRYAFRLGRKKALELQEFVKLYNSDFIKMQNWKGEIWKVQLTLNPIDFTQNIRYAPENDGTDVNLEFEGVKISG